MKHLLNSKTNVIGSALLIASIPLVIILKGNFSEWGLFAGLVFGAITGRNIYKSDKQDLTQGKAI